MNYEISVYWLCNFCILLYVTVNRITVRIYPPSTFLHPERCRMEW